ncbi:winged helix-turn-helix transcriptional regulator [Chitinophaga polysaccharea]|uniref:winged helix-turn-helix transcriptional regulator n=1 Tax=Chitinophaga polysaccharea TaxID=1293035 RepID=UPI003CD0DE99
MALPTFVQVLTCWCYTYLQVRNIDYQMEKSQEIIKQSDENCPVRRSLALLGGKWTLLILFQINGRVIRYGELKRGIPGISEKVLIQELNFLVKNKLVSKKSYSEIPPRVEYQLTDLGLKTMPIIDRLTSFGLENL